MGEIPRPLLSFLSPRLGSCSPPRAAARTGLDEVPSTTCTPLASPYRRGASMSWVFPNHVTASKRCTVWIQTHTPHEVPHYTIVVTTTSLLETTYNTRECLPRQDFPSHPIPSHRPRRFLLAVDSELTSRFALSPKLPELKATTSSHRVGRSPCFLPCVVWFRAAYLPLVPWSAIVVFISPLSAVGETCPWLSIPSVLGP
ncbi:uncharacterized protein BDZ83DRAFT_327996 [Colletotrichum acutatum]|uniref:Uncharacterized protein n=1 Tax=Glomerella acutata TaxID=27357 RepID=A0AAD8XHA7_GLOAC|nr:uncharacterized protein BDZ83DRAFT_327996 [Colletotrichum acutatum]KAK1724798.1 hypothetical protein BDZ83DRAFT_327996 [Colletotrichum acutatum]